MCILRPYIAKYPESSPFPVDRRYLEMLLCEMRQQTHVLVQYTNNRNR